MTAPLDTNSKPLNQMVIYIYGCNCGSLGTQIRQVQKLYGQPIEIKNSKYDKEAREIHAAYLTKYGLDASSYSPIVVDGDKVTLLRLWEP